MMQKTNQRTLVGIDVRNDWSKRLYRDDCGAFWLEISQPNVASEGRAIPSHDVYTKKISQRQAKFLLSRTGMKPPKEIVDAWSGHPDKTWKSFWRTIFDPVVVDTHYDTWPE